MSLTLNMAIVALRAQNTFEFTKEFAQSLSYRDELQHKWDKNSDGSSVRCRVNGKCKTWKTRPGEFRLPVKYGLNTCFYIDQDNAHEWEKV